jgi:hypothetical protein
LVATVKIIKLTIQAASKTLSQTLMHKVKTMSPTDNNLVSKKESTSMKCQKKLPEILKGFYMNIIKLKLRVYMNKTTTAVLT